MTERTRSAWRRGVRLLGGLAWLGAGFLVGAVVGLAIIAQTDPTGAHPTRNLAIVFGAGAVGLIAGLALLALGGRDEAHRERHDDELAGLRIDTPFKRAELVVAPSHREGRFDSLLVDGPFVFSVDGRRGMTHLGWDGIGYQTGLRWQTDDGGWSEPTLVFGRDPGDPVRRHNAALTSIVRDNDLTSGGELKTFDGWYLGTYHAYPSAGYEAGPGVVGVCRSRDLVRWETFGELLRPETGAGWERGGLDKSWLLEDAGTFYLFYNAKDRGDWPWSEQTGLATTTDFSSWRRSESNPVLPVGPPGDFDARFASDPCVLRHGRAWVMFYFGLSADGHARDGYATSADLVHWRKGGRILLDVGADGAVDSRHAHKPAVISWDGVLHHYYCAVAPAPVVRVGEHSCSERRGIALATSEPTSL